MRIGNARQYLNAMLADVNTKLSYHGSSTVLVLINNDTRYALLEHAQNNYVSQLLSVREMIVYLDGMSKACDLLDRKASAV